MKPLHLTFCIALTSLAGCESVSLTYDDPMDNPYSVPPPGSVIVLNEPLTFPPNHSRNNIQNGKILGPGRVNLYAPSCQFYLYDSRESLKTTRTIEPDRFEVTRSSQGVEYVQAKPVEVAAADMSVGFNTAYMRLRYDDDRGPVKMKTTMRVSSEKQPQVHEINCSMYDDLWMRSYVSVNQIIETLGDVATLELPGTAQ